MYIYNYILEIPFLHIISCDKINETLSIRNTISHFSLIFMNLVLENMYSYKNPYALH